MAQEPLIELLPNRVRRNYSGGMCLDRWERRPNPHDDIQPEDWLASTTPAVNRGMSDVPGEGLGRVRDAAGQIHTLADLFREHGEFYLGEQHLKKLGPNLGFLAKLLDSSMRLHTQVHPTRELAQAKLGLPYGKLECYVILGVRPGHPGTLRLGFQHATSRERWREIVARQDIAAMDACFEPIPVEVGQVWFVPGGMVHALGGGLLLLEVMEPSDLVVRCEFEREGLVVPPEARFMGRDLEFCLDFFDYTTRSPQEIGAMCHIRPELLSRSGAHEAWRKLSFSKTNCFEVGQLIVRKEFTWAPVGYCRLVIVVRGSGEIVQAGHGLKVEPGSRFFVAAHAEALVLKPCANDILEFLFCQPQA
jgi:mannose-6-phosphate isomerase